MLSSIYFISNTYELKTNTVDGWKADIKDRGDFYIGLSTLFAAFISKKKHTGTVKLSCLTFSFTCQPSFFE